MNGVWYGFTWGFLLGFIVTAALLVFVVPDCQSMQHTGFQKICWAK